MMSRLARRGAAAALLCCLAAGPARAAAEARVDAFGQNAAGEWPLKVAGEAELRADAEGEKAYYAAFPPWRLDPFGGLPGSGEKLGLRRTGFFHVEKRGEKWFLADPDGNAFFHLGVGCFSPATWTYVAGRRESYAWLPPLDGPFRTAYLKGADPDDFSFHDANFIRKYGQPVDPESWAERMIARVRAWGFNSAGPFSAPAPGAYGRARFPYVLTLPVESWDGIVGIPGMTRVWDPFDEAARARFAANCAARLPPRADDPLLLGYFLANEPLYEDIPRAVPALGKGFACKRRLVEMLREKYRTAEALDAAWNLRASGFDELEAAPLPVATPQAAADMDDYAGLFLEAYFQLVSSTFRRYDAHHLLLGNRLQYGTINDERLCRLMGRYLDVVSFNYYAYALDADFLRQIEKWTGGKPLLLSEFYWDAPGESGLPGGVKDVATQRERGLAYRNYVERAAALGFVVGTEWFALVDQPATGNWFSRYHGENGNTGLLSVADRPWKPMVAEMAKTNARIYPVLLGEEKPFAYDDSRFRFSEGGRRVVHVARAVGPVAVDGTAGNWPGVPSETIPRSRRVEGNAAAAPEASFKACWDDRNLYVLVRVRDATPMRNAHEGDALWKGDCVELFVGKDLSETGRPLPADRHFLFGAGASGDGARWSLAGQPPPPGVRLAAVPSGDGGGYTLEAAVPFAALGLAPRAGDAIRFDIGIDASEDGQVRSAQLMWNGTERNSSERRGWGSAVFGN